MSLLQFSRFEIIPLKSAEAAIAALPPSSDVSVTCSPAKGIDATIELTARVVAAGHHAVPHIAARMVLGPDHVARLASDFRRLGVTELFIVGGDQPDPLGPYTDGLGFLMELLKHNHGLTTIGFPAYPDGHGVIPREPLRNAMFAKTAAVEAAGLQTFVSTQMCFDTNLFEKWLRAERRAGFNAPIHLGVPGVIDKVKLMTMGARLGVGSSLRFLKKNRSTMGRLLMPGGYEPSDLVNALEPVSDELRIVGLHLFTFNEVGATAAWRDSLLPRVPQVANCGN
jgi:methylenetetrahydrofolate reductase (NADPH)